MNESIIWYLSILYLVGLIHAVPSTPAFQGKKSLGSHLVTRGQYPLNKDYVLTTVATLWVPTVVAGVPVVLRAPIVPAATYLRLAVALMEMHVCSFSNHNEVSQLPAKRESFVPVGFLKANGPFEWDLFTV
ncbi:hypothetical protein [Absidia glauca]|uniref:Uncharacterized protein n=1 Tax=Absidia glauca TaxID=4829 RepID=A0A163J2T5_ABSGL|nr:hypothetical protein [Absidia glauca]